VGWTVATFDDDSYDISTATLDYTYLTSQR
jgi:hypothetical protein